MNAEVVVVVAVSSMQAVIGAERCTRHLISFGSILPAALAHWRDGEADFNILIKARTVVAVL